MVRPDPSPSSVNKLWIQTRALVGSVVDAGLYVYHEVVPKLVLLVVLLMWVRSDVAQAYSRDEILDRILAGKQFDFVTWEVDAALAKLGHEMVLPEIGVTDADQVALVRAYMRRVADFQRLEDQISQVYIDPNVKDAVAATADLRAQRDELRAQIDARQNLIEAILQKQVESVLREEGFALGGQVIPPLRFRFTELPYVLIISRRDKIERIDQRELTTGLTVDQFDAIERAVDRRLNVSSLVSPIGGLGAYPTMLPETSSLVFTIETAAHEWTHNYLLLSPVGLNYATDPVARVINETTAVIVENEIGTRVLQRYYPDLIAPEPVPATAPAKPAKPTNEPPKPPPFDFNKEMRITRLRTDELLAAGKIDEAEAYMEERRALFVQNGYRIRKLNQAYFAFHGAYNATPGGSATAGRDPIGPAVQALRKRSASVGDFVRAIATVTTLQDLQRLAGE
jgi:hypothetical protein